MQNGEMKTIHSRGVAVLLIDMQYGFINPEKKKAIPNQVAVLRSCREKNIPLIVTEYLGEGEIIQELQKEIKKFPTYYKIQKNDNSAFYKTSLQEILERLRIKRILIMGINACYCISATAYDGVERGYKIITGDLLIGCNCLPESKCDYRFWYKVYREIRYLKGVVPVF